MLQNNHTGRKDISLLSACFADVYLSLMDQLQRNRTGHKDILLLHADMSS